MISTNPYDDSPMGEVAETAPADLPSILQRAAAAQRDWQARPKATRIEVLRNYAEVLRAEREALADLIAREAGKPLWESRTEVDAMAGKVDISIEAEAARCAPLSKGAAHTRFHPLGVVAVLGPFNFPGHLPNGHIVPALLAGNAVLFKPSEQTPLVGERLVRLLHQAGLPEPLVHTLQGGPALGRALCQLDELKGLFFTGSSRAGLAIHKLFGGRPQTLLALEMGGNNPLMVDASVDPAKASRLICQSAFVSAGQRCTCARRLVVPAGEWGDALLERLIEEMRHIVVDHPLAEPPPYIGTLISAQAARHGLEFQAGLQAAGARALQPMEALEASPALLRPGLIDISGLSAPEDEECFAPLLQVQRYASEDEAYALCNATRYGLAAGLLSEDAASYDRFAGAVRVGILNWNAPLTGASSRSPFGGTGLSGNHRPSAYLAADYCAYPVASIENQTLPEATELPGFALPPS